MLRSGCLLLAVTATWPGCLAPPDQRVRDYNEDGVYLFERGNYALAQQSFQAALALQPDDAGMLYNLGECYDRLGDFAKAEKCYRDCLEHAPKHPLCRHALVALLVQTNRRPEAERVIQEWLVKEPKDAQSHAEAGWLARQTGDLPGAQARLYVALEIDPHNERALTELGQVYEAMQRPDRALVLYERALANDPRQADLSDRVNYLLAKGAGRPRPE
jgi:Flp pilus assembly protein TadD